MSDIPPQSAASLPEPREPETGGSVGRKLVIVAIVVGLLVVAYLFAVSVLPRWWSHQVGDQVDGDLTTGVVIGFMYGFFATVLPLLVIGAVWRFGRRSVWAWLVGVPIALLLATPSLVTLGITLGDGRRRARRRPDARRRGAVVPGRHGARGRRRGGARVLRRVQRGVPVARPPGCQGGPGEPGGGTARP